MKRQHTLAVFFGLGVLSSGCTIFNSHPIRPVPVGCYLTHAVVTIDGEHAPDEWKSCERSAYVEYLVGRRLYYRHYVRCMYDDKWLYLAVRTQDHPTFGTKRNFYLGAEVVDVFPLQVLSDENHMLDVIIGSDGQAYVDPWPDATMPTKARVQEYVEKTFGLSVKTVVDQDPSRDKGQMLWYAEIRMPLQKLQPLGHQLYLLISGTKCRLQFYPKERAINWCPNAR